MVFSTFLIEGSEHNDDDTIPMHCAKRLCRDVDDRRAGIGIPMHVNVRTTTVKLVPVTIHTCNVPRFQRDFNCDLAATRGRNVVQCLLGSGCHNF